MRGPGRSPLFLCLDFLEADSADFSGPAFDGTFFVDEDPFAGLHVQGGTLVEVAEGVDTFAISVVAEGCRDEGERAEHLL
ncbi:hypothetical protein [Pseudomonas phage vB_Pae_HMKU_23]|nr:hypothetical protein [Pseudomonas phage vB_Pae_HMKU_23]